MLNIHVHFEDAKVSLFKPFGFGDLAGRDGDDLVENTFPGRLQCFFAVYNFTHIHIHAVPHGDICISVGGNFYNRRDW